MTDLSHRRVDARVRILDEEGRPAPGARVTVSQTAHAFGFGSIGFDFVEWIGGAADDAHREIEFFGGAIAEDPEAYAADWLRLFNTATLPFYWRGFEPTRGDPDTDRLLRTARWLRGQGVAIKGHPLVWHTMAPRWLLELDDDEVESAIRERIRSLVTGFAGVIDLWDAINEAVILPVFTAEENAVTRLAQRKGRLGMVQMAFEVAREANPQARLVLNDFDLSESYERLIAECLDAGVEIDALGVQTHMQKGYRGEDAVWNIMDRFARFGLPLQMTETTLVSGDVMPSHIVDLNDYVVDDWPTTPEGEARQADEAERHYRTVFSHPAVESLTYWGFGDRGAWLRAPTGFLRRDGSRKPSFGAIERLIRGEWWTPRRDVVADGDGIIRVDGFAGEFRIDGEGGSGEARLESGTVETDVRLMRADAS